MALVSKAGSGTPGRWFVVATDHGKPVRFKIRQIPQPVEREIQRRVYGSLTTRKSSKESVAKQYAKAQEFVALKAAYALVETENFNVELADEAAAKEYSELLGIAAEAGKEVCLDSKITDDTVRTRILGDFPKTSDAIVTRSERMTQADIEEEDEATESF